jgi:hypothetical protein
MRCRWREFLVLGAGLTVAARGAAAQHRIRELGLQSTATLSDPALAVVGLYGAVRSSGRTRLSLGLGAGVSDGDLAVRGELLGHFLLSPDQRRKPGFYLAGGVAGVEGAVSRGYVVLTAGVEQHPRGPSGWALELGFGGGARLALAYRWRWFSGMLPN